MSIEQNTNEIENHDKREALLTQLICEVYYCLEPKLPEIETIEIIEQMKQEFARTLQEYTVQYMETQLAVYHPWENYIKSFSVSKYIEGMSKGTIQVYLLTIKDFFETTNKSVEKVVTNDIRAFLFKCESINKNSKRTLDFKRGVLNVFFEWLVNEEYISNNPARKIKPIKYEENYRQPLTQVELELIRNSCVTLREKALVEVLYSTGARVSEISNLNIRDVDFNTKEVLVYG